MPISAAPVIVSRVGSLGRLHLNRPKALNSLTLQMVRLLDEALTGFETDDRVASVLITGAGERGLCAGGDIIALYASIRANDGDAARFIDVAAVGRRPSGRRSRMTRWAAGQFAAQGRHIAGPVFQVGTDRLESPCGMARNRARALLNQRGRHRQDRTP